MLAALHASGADAFGADHDGFIGTLPLPNKTADTWPEFFAVRRILPYLKLAADRGHIGPAGVEAVESVVRRIVDLAGPEEPPARIHGDLWSGNVVWNAERHAVLLDPAAHGGHRESDLAMLALFGLPQLARVQASYEDVTPLADGWEERQPLHQLFPLLVHAAMFGGRYGQLATEAAGKLA
jgi:fructosamine-3-kinase